MLMLATDPVLSHVFKPVGKRAKENTVMLVANHQVLSCVSSINRRHIDAQTTFLTWTISSGWSVMELQSGRLIGGSSLHFHHAFQRGSKTCN